ncbi:hypothetical protein [Solirubrum puertoriconensis]|uniref:Uncharacterized protein n=1 Tax=Solirubrum puertoriconensis TaxID=1751427 RepID=A0A9X0HP93_SOLP1|nr:hypothetical protein [Solirubrum puertoriconensis]KUG09705.1 hypothetical protein ASU33_18640 [Solirubrum puertoriconensis]
MTAFATFLIAAALLGPLQVTLAQAATPFDPAALPAKAARTAAFVPTGWLLERQISGDLNGDKRADPVLVLVERPSPTAPEARRERAVVVLLADATGQMQRVAASGKVLYGIGGPDLLVSSDKIPEIKIDKGVLTVRHISGTEQNLEFTHRFSYEPSTSKMRLVGEEQIKSNRQTLDTTIKTTDYVTGKQRSERVFRDPADPAGQRQLTSRKDVTVPTATKRYLEDVDVRKTTAESSIK